MIDAPNIVDFANLATASNGGEITEEVSDSIERVAVDIERCGDMIIHDEKINELMELIEECV